MNKEAIALIHLNNVINDLITMINKDTNDGISTKLFNQFMADFSSLIHDNPVISQQFKDQFSHFKDQLNLDIANRNDQTQVLAKIVMFNSRYLQANR